MAQMYEIPRLNTASPLAGIAQLYATYKGIERQKEQDAYAEAKDARQFGIYEEQNKLKSQEIANRNEQFLAEQAMQGLSIQERARVAEEENKLRYAPQDCTGAHANTPACIQAMAMKNYRANSGRTDTYPPEYLAELQRQAELKARQGATARGLQAADATLVNQNDITGLRTYQIPSGERYVLELDGSLTQLGMLPSTTSNQVAPQPMALVPHEQQSIPVVAPQQNTRGLVKQRQFPEFGGVR